MIQLAKKIFWAGQAVWNCGKNTSKTRWRHWRRHYHVWRIPGVGIWFHSFVVASPLSSQWLAAFLARRFCERCGKGPVGKASGLTWTHGMFWVCAQHPASGTHWGSTGRVATSFSSSSRRSPSSLQRQWCLSPSFPAETLKACALIGLHLMAAEGASGSSGSQLPDLGTAWRDGCPRSRGRDSDVDFWTEGGGAPREEVYEHNNERRALEVIGQDWSSEVVALFLDDGELARVALSCHMAMDLLCQDMRDACWGELRVAGFSVFTVLAVFGRICRRRAGRSGNAGVVNGWSPLELPSVTVSL